MRIFKRRHRETLRSAPVPEAWHSIIKRNAPLIAALDETDRAELFGHAHVLLNEQRFEGCTGLTMTEEIRVTIAALASVLLLHRDTNYFPALRSIIVYPESYLAPLNEEQDDGTVIEGEEPRDGESWHEGSLALSWADVLEGAAHPGDGYNLVLHEFAHQLDGETGDEDGMPRLNTRELRAQWQVVFGREFETLRRAVEDKRSTLLDDYGAESPAEFFAVATECFFELPHDLIQAHPELYELLKTYYRQDPANRE